MPDIKKFKEILEQKILEANNIVIVPHNSVDFDAIGAATGLALIAKKYKKQYYIVVNDPVYKIDHGVQLIIDDAKKEMTIVSRERYLQNSTSDDLFILVDVNKPYLVSLHDKLKEHNTIVIDHHIEDDGSVKASIKHIDTVASSASEITTNLLNQFKIKITANVANNLLAGIYLDTNKLSKNASSVTMKTIARLLELGANMNKVTDLFAEDFISDRRVQELVSKAQISTFSVAVVTAEDNIEYTREELAKVADYLLKYKVDAAFAIGNIGEGTVSISGRSKEKVNIGEVMQNLHGGGNQYSGATKLIDCTIEEAARKLTKIIKPPCYMK